MEIGAEISHKIRTAIKTKLVELGAYVDNELPDYIMVMVANKKRKEQMIEDLSLFLGKSTEKFTDWLLEILHKLQIAAEEPEITPEKVKRSLSSSSSTTSTIKSNKIAKSSDIEESEDFLALKAEPEDDFIEELRDDSSDANSSKAVKQDVITPTIPQPKMLTELIRPSIKPIVKTIAKLPASTAKIEPLNRKRRVPGSIVGAVHLAPLVQEEEEEDPYDPYNPAYGSVASVVKVTERKSSVPPELQANKSLLMKAVEAAHKSVKEAVSKPGQARIEPFQQRPAELFTRHYQEKPTFQKEVIRRVDHKDNVLTIVHSARPRLFDRLTATKGVSFEKTILLTPTLKRKQKEYIIEDDPDYLDLEVDPQDTRLIEYSDNLSDDFTIKYMFKSDPRSDQREVSSRRIVQESTKDTDPAPSNPKFIVTLDGADDFVKNSTKLNESQDSKLNSRQISNKAPTVEGININLHESDGMEYIDSNNIEEDGKNYVDQGPPAKKEKLSERCRFWPGCKNAESCPYHHPSIQCRMFPNCKFGDRCLYIHPNCKFDAKCAKKDCPYTHASKRTLVAGTPIVMPSVVVKPSLQQVVCRFYPECKNMNCQFYHPKPCRFGLSCSRPDCSFYHPPPPSRNKLKWVAPAKHMSQRQFALSEGIESMPVSANVS